MGWSFLRSYTVAVSWTKDVPNFDFVRTCDAA